VWEQFDQGTQRATLRLHRSIDGTRAEGPADPASARALLIWGEEDPWFPVALADPYRELLPSAQLERIAEAGHWPWLDQPHVIDRVAAFLER
jgi:pimeloyl-ACP methyl ester carboxylesterase